MLTANKSNNYQGKINMKKLILAGLVLIAAYQVGFAQGFESTDGWYCEYYSSGNQCYLVGSQSTTFPSTATTLFIPSSVSNEVNPLVSRTVTQLGNGSTIIYDQPYFYSLSTPSTIQSINSYAFANLQNLTTVVINGSPCIEPNAFFNCPHLTDVPSVSCDIGDSAFEGCTKLINVGLKDGVTKIGKRAFANCKNLKSLTIPRTVISIEPDAFDGSGLKQVTLLRGQFTKYPNLPKGAFVRVQELNQ
jgi:BspA type Leucine rich repeat region (6 copies)